MTTVDVICYKYKPLKNGELPIKIRICKDRKTRYINLGVSTQAEDWDFEKNRPKPSCPNKEVLEKLIYNKISEIKRKIVELKSDNKDFSAATLVENVSNPTKFITVGELFKQHIHCLEEGKRTGYRLSIQQTYNSLLKFNRHLDILFSEMDCNWLRRYETWLRKQGKSENNRTYEVSYLFEHDGVKVYRFMDMGNYVYFTTKGDVTSIKNDSTKERTVTIYRDDKFR